MAKSGSGRPASRQTARGRHQPTYVPGVPGLPIKVTFRVREPRYLLFTTVGLVAGSAGGAALWRWVGWRFAIPAVLIGVGLGLLLARFLPRERCIEQDCGAVLPRGVKTCPKCGGTIIGALAVGSGDSAD